MSALSLHRVTLRIGSATILDDVSLTLPSGAVTGIIGPNGAGKSSVIAVASGQLHPQGGNAYLGTDKVRHLSHKQAARRRAVVTQDVSVAFPLIVREVVAMGRTALNSSATHDEAVAHRILEQTQLMHLADREVTTLSGGERQRVAYARVLAQASPISDGSVILFDEPTSAMDIAHAEATLHHARELAAGGAAVGIVLHDIDAAAAFADQLVLMDRGRVRAAGSVRDVCAPEILSDVYGTPIDVSTDATGIHIRPVRSAMTALALVGPMRKS